MNGKTHQVNNDMVIQHVKKIQSDPDTDYGHRKMTTALMIAGYHINHKKLYRLMKDAQLLKEPHRRTGRTFVKYRTVMPEGPLEVLEMDIKQVWVTWENRYAFILTVIDASPAMPCIGRWALPCAMVSPIGMGAGHCRSPAACRHAQQKDTY